MTNLILHPQVPFDIAQAANYYGQIDPELGDRFLDEAWRIIDLVQANPEHYNPFYLHFRRRNLDSFPYLVIFEIIEEKQAVHIVSVFMGEQHEDTWKDRI